MTEVIVRHRVNRDFTTLDNRVIRDNRLSWKATGLLVYLLHLPSDWRLKLEHLGKQKKDRRDATRSGLAELEELGYLAIVRDRAEGGKFGRTIWLVTDRPELDRPCSENPNRAIPPSEDASLLKTKASKKFIE